MVETGRSRNPVLIAFVVSAGAILALTGLAKVWSGLGNAKFLAVSDPIIGIKFGQLMLLVGVAEIVIALVCFFTKRQTLALSLVSWMSTNFVIYRLGLWWMNWHRPCGCLGSLTDAPIADKKKMKRSGNSVALKMTVILLAVGCFESNLFAQAFTASGAFENTVMSAKGDALSVRGSFDVYVDNCRWRIRTSKQDESLDYIEVGGEAGEIYLLASHTNDTMAAAKDMKSAHPAGQLEVAFGQISSGVVPHFAAAENASILWLAYASTCHIQARTNGTLEPIYWFGGQYFFNRGLTLPALWQTNHAPPHLPSKVIYFSDGYTRGMSKAQEPVVQRYPEPYQDGFTNAVFEVADYVKSGSNTIPSDFSLTIYRPKPMGYAAKDLLEHRKFHFTLIRHTELAQLSFSKPLIPGLTVVKDDRFAGANGATQYTYTITNRWPTASEVLRDRRLMPTHPVKRAASAIPEQARPVRMVVLCGLIGSPLVILLLLSWLRNKKERDYEHKL